MKKAFTLPEAVICVAIIAVLAAVMVPGLLKVKPDEEKLMVKKAYSTTSEIISYLANDVGIYSRMQADGFADAIPYTDLDGIEYSGAKKFCAIFASKVSTASQGSTTTFGDFGCSTTFTSVDGISWKVATSPSSTLVTDIDTRVDQADYATISFKPPKPADASWRTIYVSRYGRLTIKDQTFVDMLSDVNLNK